MSYALEKTTLLIDIIGTFIVFPGHGITGTSSSSEVHLRTYNNN